MNVCVNTINTKLYNKNKFYCYFSSKNPFVTELVNQLITLNY